MDKKMQQFQEAMMDAVLMSLEDFSALLMLYINEDSVQNQ